MPISIERYIDITSGVGGASSAATRDFGGRIITDNAMVPYGHVLSATDADDVLSYFGAASAEYKLAVKYFGFVSKTVQAARKLSFWRYNDVAIAPMLFGDVSSKTLTKLTAVTNGALVINDGATDFSVSALNLSTATTLAGVASLLQTAIRGGASGSTTLASATVAFNQNSQQFVITGATSGETDVGITVTAATTNDCSELLGLSTSGAVSANGADAKTPVESVSESAKFNNDFGSFVVLPTLTSEQIDEIGAWTHAQNCKFMYCVATTSSTEAATLHALLKGYSGVALTLTASTTDFAQTVPMEILGAIDWTRPSASQNFMFYQLDNRTATALDDADADALDSARCNYMGQVQQAGSKIAFYQRGILMGGTSAPTDMTTFVGEMWLKDRFTVDLLNMFLAIPNIPANEVGRCMALAQMQGGVDDALMNGVISAGKTLTTTQKSYITTVTGDATAWQAVQTKGYWIDAEIVSYVNSQTSTTEYKCVYTLIYSKNDQIRKVTGSNILI